MGRKKIEIRPLTDERNRNVTFLKRKAGLMKKAWELSVLCAADVSIMIFSSQGKAYEFSSKELDSEIDKYLDYEGLIERRRAEEFAAMAAAGEDDDDDEDETPRRGSTSKVGPNGAPAPTKSLKGKESFKSRLPSRAELSRAVSRAKAGKRSKRDRRRRRADRDDGRSRGFIEGILSDDDSSSEDLERDLLRQDRDDRKRRRREEPQPNEDAEAGLAGLNYALNIHQNPQAEAESLPNFFAHAQPPIPRPVHRYPPVHSTGSNGYDSWPPQIPPVDPSLAYNLPQTPAPLPNGMQWDPNLVARFAEYQLQQNHQKQQRVLLERQRAQLAEMGIPVDDRALLDQIFGNGPVNPAMSPGLDAMPTHAGHASAQPQVEEGFAWPTFNRRVDEEPYGYAPTHLPGSAGASATTSVESDRRYGDADAIPWGVGGVPTPQSPPRGEKRSDDRAMYDAMEERRRRSIMGLPM